MNRLQLAQKIKEAIDSIITEKGYISVVDLLAGVRPTHMGTEPIPAIKKVLKVTGLTLDQIDLIESTEAFAPKHWPFLKN